MGYVRRAAMRDMNIAQLTQSDVVALSRLLSIDSDDYKRYFIPFATDEKSLAILLASVVQDRYWGIWFGDTLVGLFMLRGFDEGYQRPSFGVYIACAYSGKGLARLALEYCISWCRLNDINRMMLKVHPENCYARQTYEDAGFVSTEICERTGHTIMERHWGERQ